MQAQHQPMNWRQQLADSIEQRSSPLASGGKELAVSKRGDFVSYRKQDRSACGTCSVSTVRSNLGFPTLPP